MTHHSMEKLGAFITILEEGGLKLLSKVQLLQGFKINQVKKMMFIPKKKVLVVLVIMEKDLVLHQMHSSMHHPFKNVAEVKLIKKLKGPFEKLKPFA